MSVFKRNSLAPASLLFNPLLHLRARRSLGLLLVWLYMQQLFDAAAVVVAADSCFSFSFDSIAGKETAAANFVSCVSPPLP